VSRWDPTDDPGIFAWEGQRPVEDALRYTQLDEPLYHRQRQESSTALLERSQEQTPLLAAPAAGDTVVYEIFASKLDTEPARRAERLLSGLASLPWCSLMTVAQEGSLRFFVEAPGEFARQALMALSAAYPQAEVEMCGESPWRLREGEEWQVARLRLQPGKLAPLARVEAGPGARASLPQLSISYALSDAPPPLPLAVLGMLAPGERAVLRLDLAPAAASLSTYLRGTIYKHRAREQYMRQARLHYAWQSPVNDSIALVLMLGLVLVIALGAAYYREGNTPGLVGLGAATLLGTPLALYLWHRLRGEGALSAEQAQEKMLAGSLLAADVRVAAFGPARATARERLVELVERQAAAARTVAHPAGGMLVPQLLKGGARKTEPLPAGKRDILGSAELALLFHLDASLPLYRPAGARMVLPRGATVQEGCPVGVVSWQGREITVRIPQDLLLRHQLLVAKTQRGKSSLLLHLSRHLMARMVEGEKVSLVVMDPHGDLAQELLGLVPSELVEKVAYLDFSAQGQERPVGLNLLDVRIFPDKDRHVERLVTIFKRLSLAEGVWGQRMEGLLRTAVTSLYVANQGRVTRGEEQYTILDVVPLVTNQAFRHQEVLRQVPDPSLLSWWKDNFEDLTPAMRSEVRLPVTGRVSRWGISDVSRLFVGQPDSTVDPRAVLREGGILVVNVPVGDLGENTAGLLGATILNLVSSLIEEQVDLPRGERQRVVVLVDESSTLGAAAFERMLAELAKYGLSLVMVTQSLASLSKYDRELRSRVFANIDGLTVFTVSAEDAQYLRLELGHGVTVEDLVSLPDHEAYARWWAGGETMPTFRFRLLPPPEGSRERADEVRRRSAEKYGRPREEVEQAIARRIAERGAPDVGPGFILPLNVREIEDSEYEL